MTTVDRVKTVLDEVRPLVRAQDFARVCERLEAEIATAIRDGQLDDAASLSTMLGSFRSMTGNEEAALSAFCRAEELDPTNPRRRIATATHLFSRLERRDEARAAVLPVLNNLDAGGRHEALALLGRIAASEQQFDRAADLLVEARAAATAASLDAMFWDVHLARTLIANGAVQGTVRAYLEALLERAAAEPDEETVAEATKLLGSLAEPGR